jgi:ABC-2 type transport system ATP-binding protein
MSTAADTPGPLPLFDSPAESPPGTGAAALVVCGLGKRYGSVTALEGAELTVGPGELVGLVGANGAGKSTLMKIACGLVRPTTGTARIFGAHSDTREARRRLGYLAELFRFPGWCTGSEVLALHQRLSGSLGGRTERAELLELVGLSDAADRRVEEMSKGMQQRLGIAQALVGGPSLLLLDEPTSALDPAGRRTIRTLLLELRARGIAVLLNSHLLGEVERVCDRAVILAGGKVVTAGRPDELTMSGGVEIQTGHGTRRFPDARREDVPRIVAQLVSEGVEIYEVTVIRSTLEDAYLQLVDPA